MSAVVVDVTFRMVRNWATTGEPDAGAVEFWLGESSHCMSNEIEDLVEQDKQGRCPCMFHAKTRFVRVATPEEEASGFANPRD